MGARAINDGSIWHQKLEGCSLRLARDQPENFVVIDKDFFPKCQTTEKQHSSTLLTVKPLKNRHGLDYLSCVQFLRFTRFTYPSKDAPDVAAN